MCWKDLNPFFFCLCLLAKNFLCHSWAVGISQGSWSQCSVVYHVDIPLHFFRKLSLMKTLSPLECIYVSNWMAPGNVDCCTRNPRSHSLSLSFFSVPYIFFFLLYLISFAFSITISYLQKYFPLLFSFLIIHGNSLRRV